MFVFLENGLLRQDGSVNTELVYYLTNYHVDFSLVTEKSKTALNKWDVSEAVKNAGFPQEIAANCVFDATIVDLIDIGQQGDIVFTDNLNTGCYLQDKFRIMDTQGLAAYVV